MKECREKEAEVARLAEMARPKKRDDDLGLVSTGLGDVMLTPILLTAMKQMWELGRRTGFAEGKEHADVATAIFMRNTFKSILGAEKDGA